MKKPKKRLAARGDIFRAGQDNINFCIGLHRKHGVSPDEKAIDNFLEKHPEIDPEEVWAWRATQGLYHPPFGVGGRATKDLMTKQPRGTVEGLVRAVASVNLHYLLKELDDYGMPEGDPRPSGCHQRLLEEGKIPEGMCGHCASWKPNRCHW